MYTICTSFCTEISALNPEVVKVVSECHILQQATGKEDCSPGKIELLSRVQAEEDRAFRRRKAKCYSKGEGDFFCCEFFNNRATKCTFTKVVDIRKHKKVLVFMPF